MVSNSDSEIDENIFLCPVNMTIQMNALQLWHDVSVENETI